jgi:PAS domain S-box-containing protein
MSIVIFQGWNRYNDFKIRSSKMRSTYINQQKKTIYHEVNRVFTIIEHKLSEGKNLAREIVKTRAYGINAIASHIYEKNHKTKDKNQITEMIIEALQPIGLTRERGTISIIDSSGLCILNTREPSLEGQSLLSLKDDNGILVKEELELLKHSQEGYLTHHWLLPDSSSEQTFETMNYVKAFEPYDWSLKSGLYTKDVETKIEQDLLSLINSISYGSNKDGYVFIFSYDGTTLINASESELVGKNTWELTDPDGVKVIQEARKAAKNPEGDYIFYSWRKPSTNRITPKVSFVKGFQELNWMIGAGVYLDDIEANVSGLQEALKEEFIKETKIITFVIVLIFSFFLLLFYLMSRYLLKDIALFVTFFNQAVHDNTRINCNEIYFDELYDIAEDANGMLSQKILAQQNLQSEKEQLVVTLRCIGDGVITTDNDGRIVLINKVTEELTGWTEQDAIGKSIKEVFNIVDGESYESCHNPIEEVLSKGILSNPAGSTTVLISKNGQRHTIEVSGAPIFDNENNSKGVVLVYRDVTEKRRTIEELLKVQKLESVGVLAGGIAHDFNNLLTAILGSVQLAESCLGPSESAQSLLQNAKKACIRARGLTQQLLTFSKGGYPVTKTISIRKIVEDSAQFVLHGSSVTCKCEIPDDLCHVDADLGQIGQVIQNIVINARQAMTGGGIVSIACHNISAAEAETIPLGRKPFVKLTIADTGPGIPEKILDKIFDPYFSTKSEGSGLGLAVCHSIIKKHGGNLSVQSKAGEGTTFTIYLPASTKKEELITVPKHEPERCSPVEILFMDDDSMVLDMARRMLERLGHKVTLATNGDEAIALYVKRKSHDLAFDLVILDLTIPGGTGGEGTLKEILKIDPSALVIVSSGYSSDTIMVNYTDYGFKAAIAKPFELGELREVINSVLVK